MEPGAAIRVEMTKWGDRPHWEFDGIYLGADEHGEWLGFPEGTLNRRPGHEFVSSVDAVTLVTADGWYVPTFQAPGIWCDVYIDVSTPARWDGDVLRAVDLDLDVIRMSPEPLESPADWMAGPGETFIDDEDEFLEHQAAFGYPADVVAAARSTADGLVPLVRGHAAPYDGSHQRWLATLNDLRARP
ncbi:DUF402 domain-containing protein [Nocardioides oleivorans]|uniref:DUF402 domain-containing protein n=1 Tax=Nocardioides oleivorans TaxID=273676 RepID=A0A4V1RL80_9ACTN|nr:DUF402 domain-containing protein [Nocardioides oleivorans]RYB94852.1 DUF402 domain-containing protein [Nocardioides oleivorans]